MAFSVADLWQYYAAELLRLALGQNFNHTQTTFDPARHHLSVAGLILAADLGNQDRGIANLNRYTLANNIPAWSLAYTNWSQVFTTYRIFLDFIDLNPEAAAPPSATLQTLHAQLLAEVSAAITPNPVLPAPLTGFITAHPEVRLRTARLCDNLMLDGPREVMQAGRRVSGDETASLKLLRARLQATKLAAYGQDYMPILEAINKCGETGGAADISGQNQYNMLITTDPGDGYHSYAPAFTIAGFDETYQEWLADSAAGRTGATIVLNPNSPDGASDRAHGQADVLLGNADFFLHPSVTGRLLQQPAYEFELSFTGLGTFQLVPGSWFDLHLLEAHKASLPANAPRFFGADGSLSLLPSLAILCLEPELKMRWTEPQTYELVRAICQAAPASAQALNCDAGEAAVADEASAAIRFLDESSTIIFGPIKTSVPNLLGVISFEL